MGFLDLADHAWPLLGRLVDVHTSVYRMTGGRIGHRVPGGSRMLLLDHTGARSGVKRTTALVYVTDGANLVIIASKGGHPKHPGWYHNLVANPDTAVQVGSEHRDVRARVATGDERARLWKVALTAYSGFDDYQERTGREIPVVVLEPRSA